MITNRRNFLLAGGLGLSALGLPSFTESKEIQAGKKSVIFIHLGGGIASQEFSICKPDALDRARSTTGYTNTNSGFQLGGTFTQLAKVSHLFSTVHSFKHNNNGHQGATAWAGSGYNFTDENTGAAQKYPSYGSIIAKQFGPNSQFGIPTYVTLNKTFGDGPAYLGNIYSPFNINEEGKKNLVLGVEIERFNQRMIVLNEMDKRFKLSRTDKEIDSHKKQSHSFLTGTVGEVFNINNETNTIRELYGKDDWAIKCLMGRRLIENGVRFVTLNLGGWDFHDSIQQNFERQGPKLDHALATLIADLQQRGMLDDTLLIVTSEFSRTLLNKGNPAVGVSTPGRDHFSAINSLLIAGKNYGGSIIGESDKNGMEVVSNKFEPIDLLKTIITHMEIPVKTTNQDLSGRPRYILENDAKIII